MRRSSRTRMGSPRRVVAAVKSTGIGRSGDEVSWPLVEENADDLWRRACRQGIKALWPSLSDKQRQKHVRLYKFYVDLGFGPSDRILATLLFRLMHMDSPANVRRTSKCRQRTRSLLTLERVRA